MVTESGKIATWYDESVSHVTCKLEHPATLYPEFQNDKIISLHTCVLYTAVRLESGAIYWWGVLPFAQRKKLLEKHTNKKKTTSSKQQKKKSKSATAATATTTILNSGNNIDIKEESLLESGWQELHIF